MRGLIACSVFGCAACLLRSGFGSCACLRVLLLSLLLCPMLFLLFSDCLCCFNLFFVIICAGLLCCVLLCVALLCSFLCSCALYFARVLLVMLRACACRCLSERGV